MCWRIESESLHIYGNYLWNWSHILHIRQAQLSTECNSIKMNILTFADGITLHFDGLRFPSLSLERKTTQYTINFGSFDQQTKFSNLGLYIAVNRHFDTPADSSTAGSISCILVWSLSHFSFSCMQARYEAHFVSNHVDFTWTSPPHLFPNGLQSCLYFSLIYKFGLEKSHIIIISTYMFY